nr:sigma 54-interacting transcriptional regulator [uncultured Rhodopila sp.]
MTLDAESFRAEDGVADAAAPFYPVRARHDPADDFICCDPAMVAVVRRARQAAESGASVLISGESGTGKEVIARFIHNASRRAKAAFVALNCAAIPDHLLESELFGHERGAFSGAIGRRIGKLEAADGGTILLDEISEMDLRLQAKLLRAVQEREVDRVGGQRPMKVDIRILATTNKDLLSEVKKQTFREDLYFRLNVIPLHIPSLRQRPDDIPVLARYFLRKYDSRSAPRFRSFSDASIKAMLAYHWPGNVRELENAVNRAIVLATEDEIRRQCLDLFPPDGNGVRLAGHRAERPAASAGRPLWQIERDAIIDTLVMTGGNRTRAAEVLGISIRCLRNKLQLYASQGFAPPGPASRTD